MTRKLSDLGLRLPKSRRRKALDKRLAKTETRLKGHDERLNRQNERFNRQNERLKGHGERLTSQGEQSRKQREMLREVARSASRTHSLFEILSSQIGAIEERLQSLADMVELGRYDATDQEKAEARTLLEEIREEHRRIRVRFGVVARYEERVRRLESALAEEVAEAAELAREAAKNGTLANAPTHGAVDIPEDPPSEQADREATRPAAPGP